MFALTLAPGAAHAITADAALEQLVVVDEQGSDTYDRELFQHWTSANGCTTRQRVLQRQNLKRPRPRCTAQAGRWFSPYDGRTHLAARALDIDHVVALSEAWASGARDWNADTRKRFANDAAYARSLIAVTAAVNRSKSDKDPAEWVPPRAAYGCAYAASWVAVKHRWKLTIDQAEKDAIAEQIAPCAAGVLNIGNVPIASVVADPATDDGGTGTGDGGTGTGEGGSGTGGTTPPPVIPPALPGDADGLDPRYSTCTAAKAAGYGPYVRGTHTEYTWYRDGDSDGVVCE